MAQNIQLFGPREGFLTHQWITTGNDTDRVEEVDFIDSTSGQQIPEHLKTMFEEGCKELTEEQEAKFKTFL